MPVSQPTCRLPLPLICTTSPCDSSWTSETGSRLSGGSDSRDEFIQSCISEPVKYVFTKGLKSHHLSHWSLANIRQTFQAFSVIKNNIMWINKKKCVGKLKLSFTVWPLVLRLLLLMQRSALWGHRSERWESLEIAYDLNLDTLCWLLRWTTNKDMPWNTPVLVVTM